MLLNILEVTSVIGDVRVEAFLPADPADHTAEGHAIEQRLLDELC